MRFYPHFILLKVRSHLASGLVGTTEIAHLALGFPAAASLKGLNLAAPTNSRTHSSTGTLSLCKQSSNRCVGIWFQGLLTPVLPVLFIVRSRYWFVIGR